tara:strand:+ start:1310 stop:1501 length:192 start_codon:yes stop_codon:yes gene_type:complete
MEKRLFPKWLYYTFLIIAILGTIQIFSGELNWGATLERNIALVIMGIGWLGVIVNSVYSLLKK